MDQGAKDHATIGKTLGLGSLYGAYGCLRHHLLG
jgi:hypothetical protein